MSDYQSMHEYEPLRVPSNWGTEEKRFIAQLTEILDDIYRRYGRLRMEDFGKAFQDRIERDENAVSEVRQTAEGLETRVQNAEGAASEAQQTADGLSVTVQNLAGDIAELDITASGIMAAVNNNRLSFSVAGLQIMNAYGQTVFRQDNSTGNLTITGTITADGGHIGGLYITPYGLSYGNLSISTGGSYPELRIGDLIISGNPNQGMIYGDPESPTFAVNYRGVYVGRWQ